MSGTTKICTHCNFTKPLADFYWDKNRERPRSRCKTCDKAKRLALYHRTKRPKPLRPERTCLQCQETFQPKRVSWNGEPVKYCSRKCSAVARDKRRVDDGSNRSRQRKKTAAKLGITIEEYEDRSRQAREADRLRLRLRLMAARARSNYHAARKLNRARAEDNTEWQERRRQHQNKLTSQSIMRRYYADPDFRDKIIANSHARKAKHLGFRNERILIKYLGDRDGWRCGICHKPIRNRAEASPDHIVSVNAAKEHGLEWHSVENLQVSHLTCNLKKQARGANDQLRLVG